MKARSGQEVRIKGTRGTWTITGFYRSPARGECAHLRQHGRTRIIPLDKLKSKSGRPLEKGHGNG